jgi:hypothetical protein
MRTAVNNADPRLARVNKKRKKRGRSPLDKIQWLVQVYKMSTEHMKSDRTQ